MPLQMPDTRIALSGLGGGSRGDGGGGLGGAMQTFGDLVKFGEVRDAMDARRIEMERKRREEEDDLAIRSTLERVGNEDDAIEDLYRQGRAEAASALGKQVYGYRKTKADAFQQQVDNVQKRIDLSAKIMSGVTDQATHDTALPAVGSLLEPVFGSGIYEQIGKTYDKDNVQRLVDMGMSASDRLAKQNNAATEARLGIQLMNQTAKDNEEFKKNKLDARPKFAAALSSAYQASRSPEEWTTQRDTLVANGAPKELADLFGEFDPSEKGMARVRKLGLTPAQEESDVYRDFMATVARDRADEYTRRGGEAAAKETGPSESTVRIVGEAADKKYRDLETKMWKEYGDPTDPKTGKDIFMDPKTGLRTEDEAVGKKINFWIPDDIRQEVLKKYGEEKISIENEARKGLGLPPLEEAMQQALRRGDEAGYNKLKTVYGRLTAPTKEMTPEGKTTTPPTSVPTAPPRTPTPPPAGAAATPGAPPSPAPGAQPMQSETKNPNDLSKLSKSDLETLGNDLVKQRNATKDPTVRADLRKRIDAVRQAYQAR